MGSVISVVSLFVNSPFSHGLYFFLNDKALHFYTLILSKLDCKTLFEMLDTSKKDSRDITPNLNSQPCFFNHTFVPY